MNKASVNHMIIAKICEFYIRQIRDDVIEQLKNYQKEACLFPEDNSVANVWEEICVLVQTDYGYDWEVYETNIDQLCLLEFDEIPMPMQHAIFQFYTPGEEYPPISYKNEVLESIRILVLTAAQLYRSEMVNKHVRKYKQVKEELAKGL